MTSIIISTWYISNTYRPWDLSSDQQFFFFQIGFLVKTDMFYPSKVRKHSNKKRYGCISIVASASNGAAGTRRRHI